jgi:AraC-like DNA-binding protein
MVSTKYLTKHIIHRFAFFCKEIILYKKRTKDDKMENFSVIPLNGGRFISRGKGRHEVRKIDSDELIFCVKGTLSMFEEGRLFELRAGDYLLLRRGRKHGGVQDYPPGLSFYWLHFIDESGVLDSLPPSGRAAHPEQLTVYLQSFLAEQQRMMPDKESMSLLTALIMRELSRVYPGTGSYTGLPKLADKAAELIKLHFNETMTIHRAAAMLKCNAEYLSRVFHLHFRETFSAMLNRIRVENAAAMLTESNASVKEIIGECGFNDPAYFRRMFFRRYGQTPSAFRKFHRTGYRNVK